MLVIEADDVGGEDPFTACFPSKPPLTPAQAVHLFAFDAATGSERWEIGVGDSGNYMASTPAVLGSIVVLDSNDGSIVGVSTEG